MNNVENKSVDELHLFFVQSSTTEFAARAAIDFLSLKHDQIEFITLRNYLPFSKIKTTPIPINKLWKRTTNREITKLLNNYSTSYKTKPICCYLPQTSLSYINAFYNSNQVKEINLIEEGSANYIFRKDEYKYGKLSTKYLNSFINWILKFIGIKYFPFIKKPFFSSNLNKLYLLDGNANIDFPTNDRLVFDFKKIVQLIFKKETLKNTPNSVLLVLDPVSNVAELSYNIITKLRVIDEISKSHTKNLFIKPHPKDFRSKHLDNLMEIIINSLNLNVIITDDCIEKLILQQRIVVLLSARSSASFYAKKLGTKVIQFPVAKATNFNEKKIDDWLQRSVFN